MVSHADRSEVFALVLAGGAGTRFWPASRQAHPKQFLPLASEKPLLRDAVERVLPMTGWERVLIAGGRHLEEGTRAILPELPAENLLLEPIARNTAACIAWGAATVARRNPQALMMVLPSDPAIQNVSAFRRVVGAALQAAAEGSIVTIGVVPTRAETGYGYIELEQPLGARGDAGEGAPQAVKVKCFVEKPNVAVAEQFFAGGCHLWNSGMFFFRVDRLLAEVRRQLPLLAQQLDRLDRAAERNEEALELDDAFAAMPNISIDHGVMERAENLAVVPGQFGWSDVGSWLAAWELATDQTRRAEVAAEVGACSVDAEHNAFVGAAGLSPAFTVNASGNLIWDSRAQGRRSEGGDPLGQPCERVIALVGVHDLIVVETDDALLVMDKHRAQDVKLIVDQLKARSFHRYT